MSTLPIMAKPRMDVNMSFRLHRELRDAANAAAVERDEDVSDILRAALVEYVRRGADVSEGPPQTPHG